MIYNTSKPNKDESASLTNQPAHRVKMAQYVGFFCVGYVLASILFMLVQTQVALNPQLISFLSVIIGAYIAVYKFTKHQRRALVSREINTLTLGSVAVIWLLTALYFLGLWLWLFDAISRQVLIEMMIDRPLPLVFSLMLMMLFTLLSARLSLWLFNRLLTAP